VTADLEVRLTELRNERDAVASTRTREDERTLAEEWLAAIRARFSGSTRLAVAQAGGLEQLQAVGFAYLFESPGFRDFVIGRVEAQAELTNKTKSTRLAKLGAEITRAEGELREARKQEALAEVERQFATEAA
jgi:hypothetical protein